MKRLLNILFIIFNLNSVFANSNIEYPVLKSLPKVHLDTPISTAEYSYFTLGSGVLLQQVGIGRRYRNLETFKGHDIGLNAHFSLISEFDDFTNHPYPAYPSIKYTYLSYKNNSPTSPYFGMFCEGALAIDKPYYHSPSVYFIPNVGLIWGRERENIRFTQLQLNIIPAVVLAIGTGMLLFGSDQATFISDRTLGMDLALGSASVLGSYNAGF